MKMNWVYPYVVIAVVTGAVGYFVASPYVVTGESMLPTLRDGQIVIAEKISPKLGKIESGDMVVVNELGRDMIKRVTKVNKEVHEYWVEGDNREASFDSREFGYVKSGDVEGKVLIVF